MRLVQALREGNEFPEAPPHGELALLELGEARRRLDLVRDEGAPNQAVLVRLLERVADLDVEVGWRRILRSRCGHLALGLLRRRGGRRRRRLFGRRRRLERDAILVAWGRQRSL